MHSVNLPEAGLPAIETPLLDNGGLAINSGILDASGMVAGSLYSEASGRRFQGLVDGIRGFVTEKRLVAGAVLATVALGMVGCSSSSERTSMPESGSPAASADAPLATTSTTEIPRPIKPDFRPGEKEELAAATGWEAVASADLTVLSRESTVASELIVVGYKGAKPTERVVNEFRAAINAAEILASRNPSLTAVDLQLGTGPKQDVGYQLLPNKPNGSERARRFVFFTANQQAVADFIPENTPQGGYTKHTSKGLSVSVLPQTQTVTRDAFVEGFRSGAIITLSPTFKQNAEEGKTDLTNLRVANVPEPTIAQRLQVLINLLAQREATSWAYARDSAATGAVYKTYAEGAVVEIPAHAKTGVSRYAISNDQYTGLGYPIV